ncbi:uncharacterized protein LOC107326241 [Python bivittatus]|uniref:Uncharacterized protein LOC107326241 n=1 Tax=Python bivittatus TaxID=176946 RepID=A0A9F3W0V8_PYTBI|nr:uncharacterized protein LOC107326241 [Python bivittatus]
MDPVIRGWPVGVQAVAATAILVQESRKRTCVGALVVSTPHQVRAILHQKAGRWLTDSRVLKYEAILMEKPDLTLTTDPNLNPAQFVANERGEQEDLEHYCMDVIDLQTKIRPDLLEAPLEEGEHLFIDGSSRVIKGKRQNGYAVIDGREKVVLEVGSLPKHWSAQTCELYALKQALCLLDGKIGTVYTDSKYAFGVEQTFGKIWLERGLMTSKGKGLVHEDLIKEVMQALMLPTEIAVVHVDGHQKGGSFGAVGNNLADMEAKEAGAEEEDEEIKYLTPTLPGVKGHIPVFEEREKEELKRIGANEDESGKWILPDGRQILNKTLAREIPNTLHDSTHWGIQALVDLFVKKYGCMGIYTVAKQVTEKCMICKKINRQASRQKAQGGRPPALRPFQCIQVDYSELPPSGRMRYLLVIVDHLTGWGEAFPTRAATARMVIKIILEQIIPRYGMISKVDSDSRSHFTAEVLQGVMQALNIQWDRHTPWHPSSN